MFEILNYVLIGTQIVAMLACCFLCGLHIGDFIKTKKKQPYKRVRAFVNTVYCKGAYQLFDIITGEIYDMYLPDLDLKEKDMVYIEFYPEHIYYTHYKY